MCFVMETINYKEKKVLSKQVKKLLKKETKEINKKEWSYLKKKTDWFKEKVNDKIPDKMRQAFETAFHKGFYFVFENGTNSIEKTMNLKKLKNNYDINEFILQKEITTKGIKKIDQEVNKGLWVNKGFSSFKDMVLGLLGIGLPDIPVFIAMILKTIYEISIKYGFEYHSEAEKIYILTIICAGVTKEAERQYYSKKADEISTAIDNHSVVPYTLSETIDDTAKHLSSVVVGTKILQGVALIGVCGSIADFKILTDIGNMAMIKYKKRFLIKINTTQF